MVLTEITNWISGNKIPLILLVVDLFILKESFDIVLYNALTFEGFSKNILKIYNKRIISTFFIGVLLLTLLSIDFINEVVL